MLQENFGSADKVLLLVVLRPITDTITGKGDYNTADKK